MDDELKSWLLIIFGWGMANAGILMLAGALTPLNWVMATGLGVFFSWGIIKWVELS